MGLQPGTDYTLFLLANGRVVPRRPIGQMLPRTFVPFGWTRKPAMYNGLPTTDFPVILSTVEEATHPAPTNTSPPPYILSLLDNQAPALPLPIPQTPQNLDPEKQFNTPSPTPTPPCASTQAPSSPSPTILHAPTTPPAAHTPAPPTPSPEPPAPSIQPTAHNNPAPTPIPMPP